MSEETEMFEDGFRITIRVEYFRELVHAVEYTSTDKEYIKRFPTHAMKQNVIIPVMQSLLNKVQKTIDTKRIEREREYNVKYGDDGTVSGNIGKIHNNDQD
jgi:hypothetical protein